MKTFLMLLLLITVSYGASFKLHTHYSCVSKDDKGEIYIYTYDNKHITGDDINLTLDPKLGLYTGYNGFDEKVAIGLIKNSLRILFGTSTIPPEEWKCTELYGKVPKYAKD